VSVGGVREVICDPKVGWLIEEGQSDRFVAAMGNVAGMSGDQRMAIATNGRNVISTHFNTESQMAKFVSLIESSVTNQILPADSYQPCQDPDLSSKARKNSSAPVI
jgi:glycosyltransferase involved in cell wall biosynthesis